MAKNGPTTLVILDGYGKSKELYGNAVAQAELLLDQVNRLQLPFFRVYESEKEEPLIYFFNGCKNADLPYETRIMIPSYTSKNMLSHPEMRAQEITDAVIFQLKKGGTQLFIINYVNPDMVGHSGDFKATAKALLFLYQQLERLYTSQGPFTAHTCNQVPLYLFSNSKTTFQEAHKINSLADRAPFILDYCLKQ